MLTLKERALGTPAANGTGSTEPTIMNEIDAIYARHRRRVGMVWGLLRMAVGWIFLWGFLDKLVGLGFATEVGKGWVNGGSPTFGFLNFASKGPFAGFYHGLAGNAVVDWLFMLGLLAIGLPLVLGIGVRIAASIGVVMLLMMYTAGFMPPEHKQVEL